MDGTICSVQHRSDLTILVEPTTRSRLLAFAPPQGTLHVAEAGFSHGNEKMIRWEGLRGRMGLRLC